MLKDELVSSLFVGVPGFYEAFFDGVADLESVVETVFRMEKGVGWHDWPEDAKEKAVLK